MDAQRDDGNQFNPFDHDALDAAFDDLVDDDPEAAGALVDEQVEAESETEVLDFDDPDSRAELMPMWATDWETFKSTIRLKLSTLWFRLRFHTVHSPIYFARLLMWSPMGLWRATRLTALWVADWNSHPARDALTYAVKADSRGTHDLRVLQEQHRNAVRIHLAVVLLALLAIAGLGIYVLVALPLWQQVLSSVGLAVAFGWAGHPADRTISDRAVSPDRPMPLTSEVIVAALSAAGIQNMTKDKRDDAGRAMINFVTPIARDGAGYRVDLDLPPGVTVEHVANKRPAVASGLRRPASCVFVEGDPTSHEGRLILYVSDKPLIDQKPKAWPLLKTGKANVFDSIPIGVDQRGQAVAISLMFIAGVIGAVPRMGKTALLRLMALGAALDPRTELHIWNFKGGLDWQPLEQVAHTYGSSAHVEALSAEFVKTLRRLVTDMERRYDTIEGLGVDLAPDGKTTDDLASVKQHGLHPVFLSVDECHLGFSDPENGKTIYALIEDLARRGPAVGIMVFLATQRPDSNSIPTGISSSLALRFCLRVTDHVTNDIVLGTGAYKSGYRANNFSRRDLGICYMAGEEADAVIVRSSYVDTLQAKEVAARARAAKVATGRLTGHAAGEDMAAEVDQDTASILDHLIAVWPVGHDRAQFDQLANLLGGHLPTVYGQWSARQVAAAVKAYSLTSVQVKRDGRNLKGIELSELAEAVADRTLENADDDSTDDGANIVSFPTTPRQAPAIR